MKLRIGIIIVLALTGCGGPSVCVDPLADGGTPPAEFVALQCNFADYASWEHHLLGSLPLPGHPPGPRTGYVNHTVPQGSTEYPVGTIILKVIQTGATPQDSELFAMVKRGNGYNSAGAAGWEFYILHLDADGVPQIDDASTAPTNGGTYAVAGGCNSCHGSPSYSGSDHVISPLLRPGVP